MNEKYIFQGINAQNGNTVILHTENDPKLDFADSGTARTALNLAGTTLAQYKLAPDGERGYLTYTGTIKRTDELVATPD